jgi:hypothetical protein
MPLSVRPDKKTESLLEQTASTVKTGKTEPKRPYELIKDLLGKGGSDRGGLSSRSEEILRKRFRKMKKEMP